MAGLARADDTGLDVLAAVAAGQGCSGLGLLREHRARARPNGRALSTSAALGVCQVADAKARIFEIKGEGYETDQQQLILQGKVGGARAVPLRRKRSSRLRSTRPRGNFMHRRMLRGMPTRPAGAGTRCATLCPQILADDQALSALNLTPASFFVLFTRPKGAKAAAPKPAAQPSTAPVAVSATRPPAARPPVLPAALTVRGLP